MKKTDYIVCYWPKLYYQQSEKREAFGDTENYYKSIKTISTLLECFFQVSTLNLKFKV